MSRVNLPLKVALVATGKKQKRIAKLLRMDPSRLSQIVSGLQPPTDDQREKIAAFLKRDIADLFPDHAA